MKIKILYLFIASILFSCTIQKVSMKVGNFKTAVKDYAYCKCLYSAMDSFYKLDTNDISLGLSIESLDYYNYYDSKKEVNLRELRAKIDSIISLNIQSQIEWKNNPNKYETALGKTNYVLSCLNLARSKQIDSLINLAIKK